MAKLCIISLLSSAIVLSLFSFTAFGEENIAGQESALVRPVMLTGTTMPAAETMPERGYGHGAPSVWVGLAQLGVHIFAFAFVAIVTYYSEKWLTTRSRKKARYRQLETDYCQTT